MASRDKVDVDTFHEGIQYVLERLGMSKFGFKSTTVSNFKSKRHESSGNELVDYSRAPCLGADQKARGLWERDCDHSVFNKSIKRPFCCQSACFTALNFIAITEKSMRSPTGLNVSELNYSQQRLLNRRSVI